VRSRKIARNSEKKPAIEIRQFIVCNFSTSIPQAVIFSMMQQLPYWSSVTDEKLVRDMFHNWLNKENTLDARDFASAVSGCCQVFIVFLAASPLVASAYGRRCVGLRPTPKIPAAREKNLWYPG